MLAIVDVSKGLDPRVGIHPQLKLEVSERVCICSLLLDLSPLAVHPLPNPSHVALEGTEGIGGAMAFEVVPTVAGRLHSNQYTKI